MTAAAGATTPCAATISCISRGGRQFLQERCGALRAGDADQGTRDDEKKDETHGAKLPFPD